MTADACKARSSTFVRTNRRRAPDAFEAEKGAVLAAGDCDRQLVEDPVTTFAAIEQPEPHRPLPHYSIVVSISSALRVEAGKTRHGLCKVHDGGELHVARFAVGRCSVITSTNRWICLYVAVALPLGLVTACGSDGSNAGGAAGDGGSGGTGGSGGQHPLEGSWEGHLVPYGPMTIVIDGSGEIDDIVVPLAAGINIVGGQVEGGPEVFTMTWSTSSGLQLGFPFLTDSDQSHAAMLLIVESLGVLTGALERDGSATTTFFEPDVVGSWSGYGYAYDQDALDFVQFRPVTAAINAGTPIGFSVAIPSGTVTGSLSDFIGGYALWQGETASGATLWVSMSPDKQFIAVQAWPPGYTGLEDFTFLALNRRP